MAHTQYFHTQGFVDAVVSQMHLRSGDQKIESEIREIIAEKLRQRMVLAVLRYLNDREFELLEKIQADHPEITFVDAFMMLLPSVDGLREFLLKRANELYDELTS